MLITKEFENIFGKFFNDVTNEKEFKKNEDNGFRIYNNAGSCMVIVPTYKTKKFIAAINEKFYQKTGVVAITCVHAPLLYLDESPLAPKGELSKWIRDSNRDFKGYLRLISFLKSRIAVEKKKKSFYPFIESNPIARRCKSCGKRPAVVESKRTFDFLCSVCYKKDQNRKKSLSIEKLAEKYDALKDYTLPEDLDQLAGTSDYIALLYADGNEMGKAVFSSKNLSELKELSQSIEDILKETIVCSLDPVLEDNHEKLPFEILNMAGDDILMFIQGKYVFDFSLRLLETFQRACKKELDISTMSMTLGAVIFRSTYPIQYAFHVTNSLLKRAKYFAKEKGESALSYICLKAPIATYSSEELLDHYYVSHNIWLTMRPYTLEEFRKLREIAGEIKREKLLPSSQREAMLRSFGEKSMKATMNFIKYQIGRMRNGESLLNKIQNLKDTFELKDFDGKEELPIWGKRKINGQEVRATPFLDILELLEIEGGTRA